MGRSHRAAAALVASVSLVLGTVVAAGVAAPASAATGYTWMSVSGAAGDPILNGKSVWATPADSLSIPVVQSADFVTIRTKLSNGIYWFAQFQAPQGAALAEGSYSDVQKAQFTTPPHPGLYIWRELGNTCFSVTGSFSIEQLERDPGTQAITAFRASFVQYCNGSAAPLVGSVGWQASKSAVHLTSRTDAAAAPSSTVSVWGNLVDGRGGYVGVPVTVSRPDATGGTRTFTATTGSGGVFRINDTMGPADRVYTLAYSGDATHDPATATITVKAVKAVSALSLSAPTSVKRATAYTLSGRLTSGGKSVAGAYVSLLRKDLAGSRTLRVRTTSTGAFSVRETPQVGGTVSWTASYGGSSGRTTAKASRNVAVSRASTSLSIKPDRASYAYGATAKLTVRLGTTYNGRTVSVYAKRETATSWALIGRGRVSAAGYLVVPYRMTMKTALRASFAGDYRYRPASTVVTRWAGFSAAFTMSGFRSRSGSTYTYGASARPAGVVDIRPFRPSFCTIGQLQALRGGTWTTVSSSSYGCIPINDSSQGSFVIQSTGRPGTMRFRVSVPASGANLATISSWIYFRFV